MDNTSPSKSVSIATELLSSRIPAPLLHPATDEAEDRKRRWKEADTHRRRVSAGLNGHTVDSVYVHLDGRESVQAIRTPDGGMLSVQGRPSSRKRRPDPSTASVQVGTCGSVYGVSYSPSVGFQGYPYTCKRSVCPVCSGRRAAVRTGIWSPRVSGLLHRGYQVVALTLTQPTQEGTEPVHLSQWERQRLSLSGPVADPGAVAVSTPGESLSDSMARLDKSLRLHRYSGDRSIWSVVVGGFAGRETTGRTHRDGQTVLRWHTHCHLILVLEPGTVQSMKRIRRGTRSALVPSAADVWWSSFVARWCRLTGSRPSGQYAEVLLSGADRVEDAVKETMKYPVKLASLTDAQLVDWEVSMKGRRLCSMLAGFHGSSSLSRVVSWVVEAGSAEVPCRLSALSSGASTVPSAILTKYRCLSPSVVADVAEVFASTDAPESDGDASPVYVPSTTGSVPSRLTRREVCRAVQAGMKTLRILIRFPSGGFVASDVSPVRILEQLCILPPTLTHGNIPDSDQSGPPGAPSSTGPPGAPLEAS